MDVLAIAMAGAGLVLASYGHVLAGATVSVSALAGLAGVLFRNGRRRTATVLPFSFGSHFAVMPLCYVAAAVLQKRALAVSFVLFGFWIFYYACIALAERKIRYGPWGTSTAEMTSRPFVYWTLVTFAMAMAALCLGGALASAAGLVPLRKGGAV